MFVITCSLIIPNSILYQSEELAYKTADITIHILYMNYYPILLCLPIMK